MMEVISLFFEDFVYLSLAQVILFLIVGVPIGYLLVYKNLGLFSDSLSHSLIPGIAGAIFSFGLKSKSIALGAIFWGIIVSILFSILGGLSAKKRDSFLVTISLLGISSGLIINQGLNLKIDFSHLLFGSPLLTTVSDLVVTLVFSLTLGVVIVINWRRMLLFSIDPDFAKIRFGEYKMNFTFTLITSLLVILGFTIFGVVLTTGLLILPALLFERKSTVISRQIPFTLLMTVALCIPAFAASNVLNLTFSATLIFLLSFLTLGKFVLGERK